MMRNKLIIVLLLSCFTMVLQAQSISGEFDVSAIGVEGTSELTVTANPPNVDQDPGEFQVLIDFPNDGSYIDITGAVAQPGAPAMTWIQIVDGGGSDTWLGTNDNVVPATIGGGQWKFTVEGIGPDSGGNQVFSVVSVIYNDGTTDGNLLDNSAGLILDDLLPVEFSNLSVQNQNCEIIEVTWKTQSEINNTGFFVERSIGDASNFEKIGFVEGKLNSQIEQTYSFEDDINSIRRDGNVYYRITQLDVDGRTSTTNVVSVLLDCQDAKGLYVKTYPNPTINELFVNFEGGDDQVSGIVIRNSLNKFIAKVYRENDDQMIIDLSPYTAGVYYIQVVDNNDTVLYSDKVIKLGN